MGSRTSADAGGSDVVGLVIAGAAARGPYAAGALAELLPALAAEGNPPTVLVGTSSGALSCALLARFADQGEQAGESLAQVWRDINADAVFTNAWRTLSAVELRLAAGLVLGRPVGGGLVSLVDTKPLWGLAAPTFDPDRVTANIRAGRVSSVGVAATFCPPPRTSPPARVCSSPACPQQRRSHFTASITSRRRLRCPLARLGRDPDRLPTGKDH